MFEGVAPPPADQFHKFTPTNPSSSTSPHLPLHLSFTSASSSSSQSTPPIFPIGFDPYHHHNHHHHHHQQHQVLPPAAPSILLQPNFFHTLNFNPHTNTAGATTTRSIIKNINHHEDKQLVEAAPIIQQDPAWSNEEVLSLLRIRSSMELSWFPSADFTWDHVSRKLSEVGFKRSAEKCKEKFEEESRYINTINHNNNHNYQRAFSTHDDLVNHLHNHDDGSHPQLYHNNNNKTTHEDDGDGGEHLAKQVEEQKDKIDDDDDDTAASGDTNTGDDNQDPMNQFQNASSSSNGNNITKSITNDDDDEHDLVQQQNKKREKRKREEDKFEMFKGFCQDIVDKMMAQQEEMQNKLIEDMIKRDQEKLAREEAWKTQELDRINQDLQLRSDQHGDRQSSILKFLENFPTTNTNTTNPHQLVDLHHHNHQKVPIVVSNGNNNNIGYPIPTSSSSSSAASQPNPKHTESQSHSHPIQSEFKSAQKDGNPNSNANNPPNPPRKPIVVGELENRQREEVGKRWPKDEVLALINLRCGIYNNSGGRNDVAEKEGGGGGSASNNNNNNKAPLWERISKGMMELGYRRSAKRCKEKWENINKYFRKTKDLNKKRSVDSRTCPYFHQLSSLYGGNAATSATEDDAGNPAVVPSAGGGN
ncbi:Trihelix transcription factor GTL2 [Linum grandiflorum]